MQGEEVDDEFDANKMIEGEAKISNEAMIFIDGDKIKDYDKITNQIEKYIKEHKIYGCYTIYILTEILDESAKGEDYFDLLVSEKLKIYDEISFNQFNKKENNDIE